MIPTLLDAVSATVNGASILLVAMLGLTYLLFTKRTLSSPLPPGPEPVPFVGNVHQFPAEYQEKEFLAWGRKFGDLVYMKLFGRPVLVTSSVAAARDLMEKRGAIYSDRPRSVVFGEMLGLNGALVILPYGSRFRKARKWVQVAFSPATMIKYQHLQRRETNVLLKGFLAHPDAFSFHFARFTDALIVEIAYGHQVVSDNDEYIEIGQKGTEAMATVGSPGSMLVDFFPILKYYPTWLPGSAFKRKIIKGREPVKTMLDIPYDIVKLQMLSGEGKPSFTTTLLEPFLCECTFKLSAIDEVDIKCASITLFSAGTETVASAMNTFVLAMALHPEVYQKAQEELDQVVGAARLPDLDDRESLPYLNCLIKEVYRRHPSLPIGIPHLSSSEDEYRDYRIPKGTTIIGNIWGMSRDEAMFSDPEAFRPERFMDRGVVDPNTFVFGFGRRICPGKDFANSCMFLVLANIIATMNIQKAKDECG